MYRACLLVAASTLLLVMFLVSLVPVHAGPVPRAVAVDPSYDFGSVYAGETLYHDFIIKNTGDAELKIESIHSG